MSKITKYHVVTANHEQELNQVVNQFILDGWQPYGGASQYRLQGGPLRWSQSLVQYAELVPSTFDKPSGIGSKVVASV